MCPWLLTSPPFQVTSSSPWRASPRGPLAGCDGGRSTSQRVEPEPGLIARFDREFDFGALVASSGRKVEHRYQLRNTTGRDVKILNVINHRTCCGVVEAATTTLRPGDSSEIRVTLHVGDRFGPVVHDTEIVTDLPDEPSFVLRTVATAVPPIRVEQDGRSDRPVVVGSREPAVAAFRVYASGTATEAPIDLGRLELRSTARVEWAGPKESGPSDDGLRVESRRFLTTLDPSGPPRERRAEILLRQGDQVLHRHIVAWEVVAPLSLSPRVVAIRPAEREYRVVVQARDQSPFRIMRIEGGDSGISGRPLSTSAALTQTVQIEGIPGAKNRRGNITIITDHPLQARVDLPYVVID